MQVYANLNSMFDINHPANARDRERQLRQYVAEAGKDTLNAQLAYQSQQQASARKK